MKRKITSLLLFLNMGFAIFAQQNPTGTPPANGITQKDMTNTSWSRGGNNPWNPVSPITPNTNNVFGTFWNSPIYSYTNSTMRMKINGTFSSLTNQYTINGFGWANGINTSGYVGIGENTNNLWSNKGPFSLLHLNGNNPSGVYQEIGFRPWMKIGMTVTSNSDLMYLGHRANAFDVTDAKINTRELVTLLDI